MLTFITVFESILEYGWLLNGIVYNLPLSHILCYVFGYYIGKLFSKPFTLPKKLLAIMSKLPMGTAFICLWTLLFMGKRTSNMIIQKSKSAEKFDKTTMATVKQVGCILGTLTAIITSIYLGNTAQELMLILAIISALLSMLCMILTESGRIKSK